MTDRTDHRAAAEGALTDAREWGRQAEEPTPEVGELTCLAYSAVHALLAIHDTLTAADPAPNPLTETHPWPMTGLTHTHGARWDAARQQETEPDPLDEGDWRDRLDPHGNTWKRVHDGCWMEPGYPPLTHGPAQCLPLRVLPGPLAFASEAEPDPLDENDHQDRVLSGGGRIARQGPRHWHTPTVGGPWCKWACSGLSLADWNRHNGPLTFASEAEPDPLDEDDHRDRVDREGVRLIRNGQRHWHRPVFTDCAANCGTSLAYWDHLFGPLTFAPETTPETSENENGVEVGSDTDDAPEPLLCPECGHDIDNHPVWDGVRFQLRCRLTTAEVARALIIEAVKAVERREGK